MLPRVHFALAFPKLDEHAVETAGGAYWGGFWVAGGTVGGACLGPGRGRWQRRFADAAGFPSRICGQQGSWRYGGGGTPATHKVAVICLLLYDAQAIFSLE